MPIMAMTPAPAALDVSTEQLDLVRRTVAKDATPDELALYLYDCKRQNVHPLDKLIHFTKRSGKYTPVTSIDFMRMRAADSGEMAGSDDPIFERGPIAPASATVTVYRLTQGQRFAYTATARWSEYKPDQDFMWRKMPHTMLGKCAEALALRKAFPKQLAGLYATEELDQADGSDRTVAPSGERHPDAVRVGGASPSVPAPPPVMTEPLIDLGTWTEIPAGFDLIDDIRIDNDWYHVDWGKDAQGATMTWKTKLTKVGNRARVAFNDRIPVKLQAKKFPFLDKVERVDDDMKPDAIAKTKWNPDDVPEQGF